MGSQDEQKIWDGGATREAGTTTGVRTVVEQGQGDDKDDVWNFSKNLL
jgi:hypothetical protein